MKYPLLSSFEIIMASSELAVRDGLKELLVRLQPLDLDREEAGTVELVLAEVLNNVVEHAYASSDETDKIRMRCEHKPDGLWVTILDTGAAMPNHELPLGHLASNEVELTEMPEGGFGWFLIQHLAREVTYERGKGENRLSLRLAIGMAR